MKKNKINKLILQNLSLQNLSLQNLSLYIAAAIVGEGTKKKNQKINVNSFTNKR